MLRPRIRDPGRVGLTPLLFGTVVIAWGLTWFAIRLQLGDVPPEVSILYRFALAAAILWIFLAATGRLRAVPLRRHGWMAAMGLSLFGINFLLMYWATGYVASGVASVVFTMSTVFNALNRWLFFGMRPGLRVLGGGICGVLGIAFLFAEPLAQMTGAAGQAAGVALALAGTYVFSLGNMVSTRVFGMVDLPNATVRGMTWGMVFLGVFVLARGHGLPMDTSPAYLLSLLYLAVPGSILGFLAYLALAERVGAERAAYATVLSPVVALSVSTVFEGYVWSPWAVAGLPLILAGNVVIFAPRGALRRILAPARGARPGGG